jgi:hypothetical protein
MLDRCRWPASPSEITGHLLYCADGEKARAVISLMHWVVGLGAPVIFVLQGFARERRRRAAN